MFVCQTAQTVNGIVHVCNGQDFVKPLFIVEQWMNTMHFCLGHNHYVLYPPLAGSPPHLPGSAFHKMDNAYGPVSGASTSYHSLNLIPNMKQKFYSQIAHPG